ncbi:MAG TPA: hypothetical protein VLT79_07790 [Gemmatimonadales bacterium]|nr:hypothetical protein [Gemmatimonadales bacterium]
MFTLLALVLASALVAIAWTVAFNEARIDETAGALRRSFYVAEGGAAATIRNWPRSYNFIAPYPVDSVAIPSDAPTSWLTPPHGGGGYRGYLYRLNDELYLLSTQGRVGAPLPALHRLGILLRLEPPRSDVRAALEAGGSARIVGRVQISGNDSAPSAWSCDLRDTSKAGVAAESITVLPTPSGRIAGSPPTSITPPEGQPERLRAWAMLRDVLLAEPNHALAGAGVPRVEPVSMGRHCAIAVVTNWGDANQPGAPCGGFYPVIHLTGDATLVDISGQGTLIVDGSLTLTGATRWNGIILAGGNLTLRGTGPTFHVWGAMAAAGDAVLEADSLASPLEVTYSKCAVTNALYSASRAVPLTSRSAIEAF